MNTRSSVELPTVCYQNFEEEVIHSDSLVLVEFADRSCFPFVCLDETLAELTRRHAGEVKVVCLDVIADWQTANEYAIQSQPSVLLFRDGCVAGRIEGVQPIEVYEKAIQEALTLSWSI